MQLLVDVLFSFALLFTFFGERGEVSIGLSFLAGVPKKVISLNFNIVLNSYGDTHG